MTRRSYDVRRDLIFAAHPEIRTVELGLPQDVPQDLEADDGADDDESDGDEDTDAAPPQDDPQDDYFGSEDEDFYGGRIEAARGRRDREIVKMKLTVKVGKDMYDSEGELIPDLIYVVPIDSDDESEENEEKESYDYESEEGNESDEEAILGK